MNNLEQELERSGYLLQTIVGDSMEPMLHNRKSIVRIEKITDILKPYDLPLYRRPSGQYVMHRILKVREYDYVICGDNRWQKEIVPHDWVLGVMTEFQYDDIVTKVGDHKYKLYLWALPVRRRWLWLRSIPKRIRKKMTL